MKIIIGFTQSDRGPGGSGYSSFDGYLPGAVQETREVEISDRFDAENVAEAVFNATNNPAPETLDPLATEVWAAIYEPIRTGNAPRIRALSKGDTVTMNGVSVACESYGWKPVEIVPAGRERLREEYEAFWVAKRAARA